MRSSKVSGAMALYLLILHIIVLLRTKNNKIKVSFTLQYDGNPHVS
jgi:hypothetical protein